MSHTAAQQATSPENAKPHGLLDGAAKLLTEPTQALQGLLTRYTADLQPVGAHQEMLVREVAVADYRIQQLDRIERGVTAVQTHSAYNVVLQAEQLAEFAARPPACGNCGATQPRPAASIPSESPELSQAGEDVHTLMLGAAWCQNPAAFSLLARYQAQARRDYYRALKHLGEVRTGKASYLPENAKNQTKPPEPPEPPAKPATTAAASTSSNGEKCETNPNSTNYTVKRDNPGTNFVSTPAEFREASGSKKGDEDSFRSK